MLLSPAARQIRKGQWGGERRTGEKETVLGQLISEKRECQLYPRGYHLSPELNLQSHPKEFQVQWGRGEDGNKWCQGRGTGLNNGHAGWVGSMRSRIRAGGCPVPASGHTLCHMTVSGMLQPYVSIFSLSPPSKSDSIVPLWGS